MNNNFFFYIKEIYIKLIKICKLNYQLLIILNTALYIILNAILLTKFTLDLLLKNYNKEFMNINQIVLIVPVNLNIL
jgi:hypothetical protein